MKVVPLLKFFLLSLFALAAWWGFLYLSELSMPKDLTTEGRAGYSYADKSWEGVEARATDEPVDAFVARALSEVFLSKYHCLDLEPEQYWLDRVIRDFIRLEFNEKLRGVLGHSNIAGFYSPVPQGVLDVELMSCGLCHQRAYILAKILVENDVDAYSFGLNGHVVTRYEWAGDTYFVDPDYGIGPFKLDENFEQTLLEAYGSVGNAKTARKVANMYLSEKNNDYYYSMAYLDRYALSQKISYYLQLAVLFILYVSGVFLTCRALLVLTSKP